MVWLEIYEFREFLFINIPRHNHPAIQLVTSSDYEAENTILALCFLMLDFALEVVGALDFTLYLATET